MTQVPRRKESRTGASLVVCNVQRAGGRKCVAPAESKGTNTLYCADDEDYDCDVVARQSNGKEELQRKRGRFNSYYIFCAQNL